MRRAAVLLASLLAFSTFAGCGGGDPGAGGGGGSTGASPTGSSPNGTGSGSGTASGPTTTTTGGGGDTTLRFVALGDGGEGNETQYKVADAMKAVCDAKGGCAFALYLGDNIYDDGASSPTDAQFQTKFEQPYANVDFRFYVVLGNHDYGGGGLGYDFAKGQHEVDYSQTSTKWTMPSHYYRFSTPADAGPPGSTAVDFFALDTNAIMFGQGDGDQKAWLDASTQASAAAWKIGFGHHPYISNGQHGNAGEYEGIPGIPVVSGGNVKDFMDDSICGRVDVYISGHDHNRQWLQPACGTQFIVSGTAAKTTDLVGRGTPTWFETDQKGGFLLVEITPTSFTGTFYDEDQAVEYTNTITK